MLVGLSGRGLNTRQIFVLSHEAHSTAMHADPNCFEEPTITYLSPPAEDSGGDCVRDIHTVRSYTYDIDGLKTLVPRLTTLVPKGTQFTAPKGKPFTVATTGGSEHEARNAFWTVDRKVTPLPNG